MVLVPVQEVWKLTHANVVEFQEVLSKFSVRKQCRGNLKVFSRPLFQAEADDFEVVQKETEDDISVPRSVYDQFVTGIRTGNLLRAAMDFTDAVEGHLDDIPIREREWFRAHCCAPPPICDPSPAFDLPDWGYAHTKLGKPTSNFQLNLKRVVEGSVTALNLQENLPDILMTNRAKKLVFKDVTWNPYVIFATTMKDSDQFDFSGSEQYFVWLYKLRSKIGLNGDYGYKGNLNDFQGEGGTLSSEPLGKLFDMSMYETSSCDVVKLVKEAVGSVWKSIASIMSLLTDAYESFLDKIRDLLVRAIRSIFSFENLKEVFCAAFSTTVIKVTIVYALLFFVGANVISYGVTRLLFNHCNSSFIAEGEVGPVTLVSTLAAALFGLSTKQEGQILSKARYVAGLMAGGTVVANLGACAFSLFPSVIQDAISWRFGSEEYRLKYLSGNWRAASNALLQFSTVPRVVGSAYYMEQVEELLKQGSELLDKLGAVKFNGLRSIVLNIYLKLQKNRMRLNQFKSEGLKRPEPFSVHLCGVPGAGKTLLVEQMVRRLGYSTWFTKHISDEFAPGYLEQDAWIFDEFLVGDNQQRLTMAQSYLAMCSSAQYRLNQPTLDDPLVGIKGQCFTSPLVFTLNNTTYERVVGVNPDALQRRRDAVIECKVTPDFVKYCKQGATGLVIDLGKVPPEDIRDKNYIAFRLVPSIYINGYESLSTPWTTFDNICALIKERHAEKKILSDILQADQIEMYSDNTPPEEMVRRELRKTCVLPSRPVGILEAMSSLFLRTEKFEAEGKRRTSVCPECSFTLVNRAGTLTCPSCVPPTTLEQAMSTFDQMSPNGSESSDHGFEKPESLSDFSDCVSGRDVELKRMTEDVEIIVRDLEEFREKSFINAYSDRDQAWDVGVDPPASLVKRWSNQHSVVQTIAFVGLMIGAMYGISRWFSGKQTESSQVTFGIESDPPRKHSHRKSGGKSRWTRGELMEGEGANTMETCKLSLETIDVQVIPVGGHWLMTYAHCIFAGGRPLIPGSTMVLHYRDHCYKWIYDPSDTLMMKDEETNEIEHDLMFIKVGCPQCPQFKNITSRFLNDSEYPESAFDVILRTREGLRWTTARSDVQQYSYSGKVLYLNDGFRYRALTAPGDCGSPIMLSSGRNINKCVGIHVAGSLNKSEPVGLGVRVSRDMILSAIGDDLPSKGFQAESPFMDELLETENPNLLRLGKVPVNQRVHMCSKTKLRPSKIAEFLPWESLKQPAVMSVSDSRSQGKDPVEQAILRMAKSPKVKLNDKRLHLCAVECLENLKRGLDFSGTGGMRELSFEEAVFGIPGVLSSVVTDTSPGSPYCYFSLKKGKKELVWFENGIGKYNPAFKEHVQVMYNRVKNGESFDNVFVGYMKDEVRSKSKIEKVNTRITFCDDATYNVVCRMFFGSIVAAFNSSFPNHAYAIGINPGSYDFMKIFQRLRRYKNRIVAGDFSEFDLRHQRQIMDKSFWILEQIGMFLEKSTTIFEHVRVHETCAPALMGTWIVELLCSNFSGGFWTTILNCVTCELYFRYAFKTRFPAKIFDTMISLVILGDDHLVGVSPEIDWNPLMIRDDMSLLGQVYTSAEKDAELTAEYRKFSEILFLGHVPKPVDGDFAGALRKETLEGSLMWTRDWDMTLRAQCQQMVEYASVWDNVYYESFLKDVNNALVEVGEKPLDLPPWESLRSTVAHRTVDSGEDYRFRGEAKELESSGDTTEVEESPGLTTVVPDNIVQGEETPTIQTLPEERSLSEVPATLEMGPDSWVRRTQFNWSSNSGYGADLQTISLPYGLLGMGDQHNLQNMPFQNFLFSRPEIEIMIQLNGSPTQAGCLIAFFVPLSTQVPYPTSYCSMIHVKLSPDGNPSAVLKIPFRFWRSFLNNQFAHDHPLEESMGKLHICVYSALTTKTLPSDCGVTIYSKIKTTSRIPRVVPPSAANARPSYGFTAGTGTLAGRLLSSDTTYRAEGANLSSTKITNRYNVGSIAGGMPVEASVKMQGSQKNDTKSDAKIIPMDNPPCVGGTVPVQHQFGSMSKTNGPEVTVGMALHPQEMSRQPMMFRDPTETCIAGLCEKFGRIDSFSWNTNQADGTDLISFDLCSTFMNDAPVNWTASTPVPLNIAILSQFQYSHCDVVYRFHAVRTKFHSGRLMIAVGYGTLDVPPAQKTALYNQVLDFSGESSIIDVVVPYNNTQEYIAAQNNSRFLSTSQRFGSVHVSVLNELRCSSEVVSDAIRVIVEVSLRNVRVAFPNINPLVSLSRGDGRMTFGGQPVGFAAEAEDLSIPDSESIVTAQRAVVFSRPETLSLGEKFEYTVKDIHELVRRYNFGPVGLYKMIFEPYPEFGLDGTVTVGVTTIPVVPHSTYNNLYMGWSGTLKYRLFIDSDAHCTVTYVPTVSVLDESSFMAVNRGYEPSTYAATFAGYAPFLAREVMYPVGNCSFIDVSVPFCTEFDMLATPRSDISTIAQNVPTQNGVLLVKGPIDTKVHCYVAAGDDFRYHCLVPDNQMSYQLSGGGAGTPPTNGTYKVGGINQPYV
jgi:hypothetical protein